MCGRSLRAASHLATCGAVAGQLRLRFTFPTFLDNADHTSYCNPVGVLAAAFPKKKKHFGTYTAKHEEEVVSAFQRPGLLHCF